MKRSNIYQCDAYALSEGGFMASVVMLEMIASSGKAFYMNMVWC